MRKTLALACACALVVSAARAEQIVVSNYAELTLLLVVFAAGVNAALLALDRRLHARA